MTDDDTDDIPRALRVLWEREERRARSRQQGLSLERIVRAAITIADVDGLAALSMARLAERLGCAPMSLYRHVANKDELQVFMMDAAPGPPPEIPAAGWRDGLQAWARALRVVYFRHPWILQIVMSAPPLEPGQLAWLDRGLATLDGTALSPQERIAALMLVLSYTRGEAQLATIAIKGHPDRDARQAQAGYGRIIARFAHPNRFPALAEMVAVGGFDPQPAGVTTAEGFEFGLARILDGIATIAGTGPDQAGPMRSATI